MALPDWPEGTVAFLASGGDGAHVIPVSTAVRAGDERVLFALSPRRTSLERLRGEERVALAICAHGVALTAHGRARVVAEPLPGAGRMVAVELAVADVRDHLTDDFVLDGGVVWRWTDDEAREPTRACAPRCGHSSRFCAVKLATFTLPGDDAPIAGEVRGDEVVAFAGGETVLDRLASGDLAAADGPRHALADVTLLAPVPRPRAIFGIGLNYAEHAKETGQELPEAPIVFLMAPSSAAPPGGPVVCPDVVRRLDYEGELGVVMGAGGRIAGYTVCDDVSARDLQRREPQWSRAKGFDTACPYGPWITTADEVADPEDLRLRTWVNGELRQDTRTSDLIFGPRALADFIGAAITLEPGDLILTGTPSGVGVAMDPRRFLTSGDVIRIEIESLGAIEHPVA